VKRLVELRSCPLRLAMKLARVLIVLACLVSSTAAVLMKYFNDNNCVTELWQDSPVLGAVEYVGYFGSNIFANVTCHGSQWTFASNAVASPAGPLTGHNATQCVKSTWNPIRGFHSVRVDCAFPSVARASFLQYVSNVSCAGTLKIYPGQANYCFQNSGELASGTWEMHGVNSGRTQAFLGLYSDSQCTTPKTTVVYYNPGQCICTVSGCSAMTWTSAVSGSSSSSGSATGQSTGAVSSSSTGQLSAAIALESPGRVWLMVSTSLALVQLASSAVNRKRES